MRLWMSACLLFVIQYSSILYIYSSSNCTYCTQSESWPDLQYSRQYLSLKCKCSQLTVLTVLTVLSALDIIAGSGFEPPRSCRRCRRGRETNRSVLYCTHGTWAIPRSPSSEIMRYSTARDTSAYYRSMNDPGLRAWPCGHGIWPWPLMYEKGILLGYRSRLVRR